MRVTLAAAFLLLFSLQGFNQVVIWEEDFESYPNGTVTAPPKWTAAGIDCDDPGLNIGNRFGVYDGAFWVQDVEGAPCCSPGGSGRNIWQSQSINIAAYSCVSVSLDIDGGGDMECDFPAGPSFACNNSHDQVVVEYILDGVLTQFPGGYICGLNGIGTISVSDLKGITLTIRVTLGNKANDEYYTIDNVVVTGSLLATPTITGPTTVCDGGASINLTANPAGLPSYEWSDGATGRVNSINTPGVYTVTVRNAAGCEVTSAPFTVNSAPAAPVTITGPSQICATGGTATLTANPAGLPSYQWSTGQTTRAITVSNGDVYTVTVTNAAGCTGEASFLLDEVPRPSIDPPSDLDGCGAVELPEITGSDLPGTEAYFTGANGSGTRFSAGALIPPPSRTLFLFASVPGLPGCSAQETVRVNVTQSPNIFAIPNVTVCNSYTLPPVPGTFLTGNRAYYTGSGATGTRFNPGDVITTSRVLYAYAGSDDCNDEREFTITIVPGINVNDLPDQSVCAFYVLPPITGTGLTGNQGYYTGAGGTGTRFNAGDTIRTTRTLFIYDSNAGCSDEESVTITITNGPEITPLPNQIICNSYTLPTITGANLSGNQAYYTEPNGGGTRFSPGDIITTSQRLYIYDAEGACSNEQSFVVTIVGTPDVMSVDDVEVCGFYVLPAITGDNLTGNQAYYTLANGSGTRYNVGDTIFTPQSLFIYDGAVGCSDEEVFNVNILSPPMLDAPANRTACTFFRLPAILGANLSGNEAYYTEPGGNGLSFNPGDTIRNSGTYFIFDDNGLCTDEQSFTITINAAPALDPVSAQAGCLFYVLPPIAGANLSGNEAYFTAPGGMGTRYAPGDTLRANATIFVFDDNGTCTAQQSFMVRINTLPTVTLTPRPVQCHDQSTGSIEMTVQGAAPFIFNWSVDTLTGQQNVTGLLAGFYSVTVTDSNGCAIAAETNIVQPESLIINCLQLQAVSGTGLSDGQAQLTIAGGTADYTITWTGPSNGSRTATTAGDVLLDNLPAGTYEVTLTDANNCTTTCSFAINVEGCDLDLAITGTDATCANAADGSIQTTLTGGTPDFTYTWNVDSLNGQPNPTNLAPGTYLLNVVDANNCVVTADVVIAAQFAVPTAVLSPGGSVCEDDCFDFTVNFTGAPPFLIDVAIDAGAGPQILTRTTDNFSETLTLCPADFGLTDGLIQIRVLKVMDSNCLDETLAQTATLTVQPLSLHLIETTICETANIEVNGVTYDFANPAGTEVLAGAAANGCDSIVTINLSFFPTAVFDLQQTLCENDEITINGTVYNMSNPNGTEILLEASVNGCDSIVNINLDFFPPVVNELSETLCEGESILVNGITYDQNNPIGTEVISGITANGCDSIINVRLDFFPPSVFNLNETLCEGESIEVNGVIYNQNNPNGTEILVGADVNGCDSIVNITLNFFPPSVFNLNETLCEGESIEVNGVIYNQNNLSGTEVLISASVNGCDSIVNITLNFFPPAVFDLNETLCEGASIEVNGVIYNENNPSGTEVLIGAAATGCDSTVNISLNYIFPSTTVIEETLCPGESRTVNGVLYNQNNASGTEVILGGSVNGCDSIINITLNFFPPAVFDLNETLCEGESIEVNGVIYNQNNPSGTEVLIGASSNGCDSIVNITLNFFPPSVFNLNETLCEGASMEVNGVIYNQNNPNGTEILVGADVNGCDSIVNITLNFFPPAVFDLNETLCEGESIEVNGVIYNQNNLSGTEVLSGASVNGCDSIVNITLNYIFPSTRVLDTLLCFGESLQVNGVRYDASNPTGTEVIMGGSANGCDSIIQVNLRFAPEIVGSIEGDAQICAGERTTLTFRLSGGQSFDVRYSDGVNPPVELINITDGHTVEISPTRTATYTIVFLAINGSPCSASINGSARVQVSNLTASASVVSNFGGFGLSCAGSNDGTIRANAADGLGPFTYQWSTGSTAQQLNGVEIGTYAVTIEDAAGCSAEASVAVTAPATLTASSSTRDPLCSGDRSGAILIDAVNGGVGPYEVSLDGTSYRAMGSFPYELGNLAAGNYNVFVRDANDCEIAFNTTVVAISNPRIDLGGDITIALGDSVALEGIANFEPDKVEWRPTDFLSTPDALRTVVRPAETTTYQVTASDASGCIATDRITVFVNKARKIFIPTAFSPDGDGNNDIFYIYGGNDVVQVRRFVIFDRWGNLLFDRGPFLPNDPQHGWDGRFNGQEVNIGVYVYYAEIEFIDGIIEVFEGDVAVLR